MTIIKNGLVVDGTGAPAFPADVVVEGERIASVERRAADARSADSTAQTDAETIDASGCLVTPGFIDVHSHSDAYLVIEPDAPSKLAQGITTEINGQCGGSVAPRYGEARLSSDWAAVLGEKLTWRSLAEYREELEKARPAINTVQFIGHNTLRSSVVGYAGRTATADETTRMVRLLEQSLDEGGWGLTTGLVYQPGKYSTPEEVVTLAAAAAKRGGFYATHMRSESDAILEAIDEVLELVEATGIRAEISHLKTSGRRNWGKIDAVLDKIDSAVDSGKLLGSDRYPYCAAGTDLDIVFPDWAGEGGAPEEMKRLADSSLRRRIEREIDESGRDWSSVTIGGTWHPETKKFSGKTVAEIISGQSIVDDRQSDVVRRTSPGELICSILALDGCKTGGFFAGMSPDNLAKIYSRPYVLAGSDASLRAPWGPLGADHPHPRAYGTMPEYYAALRKLGFSREDTVRRMTGDAARRFGIRGRGVVEKGAFADIVVWREAEFKSTSTYDRPHSFASGVECVMVNGSVPYRGGRFTGDRNGAFLER